MVVEDKSKINTRMNGKLWEAGAFAYNLRMALYQEHFAMSEKECIDPVSDDCWATINLRAKV